MAVSRSLLPQVAEFLSSSPVNMFIGGQWVPAADGGTFATLDPGNGSVLAKVAAGKAADVDRAVQAARKAFAKSGWATMPAHERSALLHRLADLVDANQAVLA